MPFTQENIYDLIEEGKKIREQLEDEPNPVLEARHMMSQTILSHILLALSDAGFYTYLSHIKTFTLPEVAEALDLNPFVLNALLDYLTGRGFLKKEGYHLSLTKIGKVYFNAYTRGLCNAYLGGYKSIFHHLGGILRKKIVLNDPILSRSTFHAASGTSQLTCGFTIPEILRTIDAQGARYVLDLGCGTGDFLIHLARLNPYLKAIGVDISEEAIATAKVNAKTFSLENRMRFFVGEVEAKQLTIPSAFLKKVDIVTCMYMLHEFGREGDGAIIEVLQSLKRQFPDKLFLLLETDECTSEEALQKTPEHYGRLDYRLIHILSRQGLPKKPARWHKIFNKVNCQIVEPEIKIGGSYIYVIRF